MTEACQSSSSERGAPGYRFVTAIGSSNPSRRARSTAIAKITDESRPPEKNTMQGGDLSAARTASSIAARIEPVTLGQGGAEGSGPKSVATLSSSAVGRSDGAIDSPGSTRRTYHPALGCAKVRNAVLPATSATGSTVSTGVVVRSVIKSLGGSRVLGPVDFDAPAGAVSVLVGSNGAGKTTLLRILSTTLTRDGGDVWVDGFDPSVNSLEVRSRVGVALVNERSLWWRLTALQNLVLFAGMRGVPRSVRVTESRALLAEVQLAGKADRPVSTLSAGQRQRVVLARALLGQPSVLLIDEPLRGLDRSSIDAVLGALQLRAEAGACVVVAAPLADELVEIAASVQRLASQAD